jgi:alpha-beta hydrolase superfamily lysophospholipase
MKDMCNAVCAAITKSMNLLPDSEFLLSGHSAGGQLLSTIFYEIPSIWTLPQALMDRVKGVILISATYDMRPAIRMPRSVNNALQLQEYFCIC